MSKYIREINHEEFSETLKNNKLVIVDFYSTECPPCEALASKFEQVSELFHDTITFVKIFRQGNRELAESLNVLGSPTLLFFKDGEETALRLSGGVKKAAILKNIKQMLGEYKYHDKMSQAQPYTTDYDVAIIGGGPAGLTAGIYAAQAKVKTVIIDEKLSGGQINYTHQISNYPGFEEPLQGFMLGHYIGQQAKAAGVDTRYAVDVSSLDLMKKEIVIDDLETIKAKKIIVATGSSYRELGIPGEEAYKGQGISYCATCDAKYYENKEVIVIGGGNSAIEEALFITKFAKKVTIIHQFDELQANKHAQEQALNHEKISFILSHEPRAFERKDNTMFVAIENMKNGEKSTIQTDGVFIFVGMKPNIDFNNSFELDEYGYVVTDDYCKTSMTDVYAVGDISSKPYRQITIAVADGTIAGIHAAQELSFS